jgi:hypothetical protein
MARDEPFFADLRRRLASAVESGRLLCPYSPGHRDESALARPDSYEAIDKLGDVLAMGIEFLDRETIEWNEIYAAARAFFGAEPKAPWKEAFREDPHTPREKLFFEFMGGHIRVKARFQVDEDQRAEVRHEKAKEDPMQEAYDDLRVSAFSFEEIAEANVEAMLNWKLGPIFDPERFYAALRERHVAVLKEWITTPGTDMTPGSAINRYLAFATRESLASALVERFPALHARAAEFKASTELRSMPTLRYPALLRAALASDPTKRKATPSDGYDIEHLTLGLSRCDIATADRAMTRLVQERKLLPEDCQLFKYSDVAGFTAAVENALSG